MHFFHPGRYAVINQKSLHEQSKQDCPAGFSYFVKVLISDINIQRFIDFFTYIFAVFLTLSDALRQKILNLSVDGPKIILRPRGDFLK